ncbi:MAG: hypothetical protein KJ749_06845 [Planctomycetes bacterium]|nr:hypothetical protein [Planctomycetota bacterium]
MRTNKVRTTVLGLACAGIPLVTVGTCDPRTGMLDFFRDDDAGSYYYDGYIYDPYYDGYYYDVYYYDYCGFDCWFGW